MRRDGWHRRRVYYLEFARGAPPQPGLTGPRGEAPGVAETPGGRGEADSEAPLRGGEAHPARAGGRTPHSGCLWLSGTLRGIWGRTPGWCESQRQVVSRRSGAGLWSVPEGQVCRCSLAAPGISSHPRRDSPSQASKALRCQSTIRSRKL